MSKDANMIYELLRADGSIVINKALIHAIGLNEAILYSELLSKHYYFDARGQLINGWFYNTVNDLTISTGLYERAQRTAISGLKKLGLVECEVRGMPPLRHFRVNMDGKLILSLLEKGKEIRETIDTSIKTAVGGNRNLRMVGINNCDRSTNNTKNNTNHNTKDYSVCLSATTRTFLKRFEEEKGYPHREVISEPEYPDELYDYDEAERERLIDIFLTEHTYSSKRETIDRCTVELFAKTVIRYIKGEY